jgi:hypothetical protein
MAPAFPTEAFRAAIKKEGFIRDASFVPVNESIAGFTVRPMLLEYFLALRIIESPFLVGGDPDPRDARAFLWRLSPHYSPRSILVRAAFMHRCRVFLPPLEPYIKTKRARKRWATQTIARLEELGTVYRGINVYVSETLQDWPSGSEGGAEGKSYFSDAVSIIGTIARDYGWPESAILKLPMKRALQYMKEIKQANAPGKPLFNPLSDKVHFDWLRECNRRN